MRRKIRSIRSQVTKTTLDEGDAKMRAWGPPERGRSAGVRGGGWRPRPDAVVGRGAAGRSVGSDSARAAVPGPLAGRPRFSRPEFVCCWARGCAVPGGRARPLGRRRARARVVRSRVACVGGCAVPALAGWGRGRVGAYVAGFRKGAAAAGIRGGGSRVGGRMLDGR